MKLSESEIKQIVLESKEFAYAAGEKLRDELTNEQAALLGYYMLVNPSSENLARYCTEIIYPIMSAVLVSEVEYYKDKHCLNEKMDDCSAFKNHREENPEMYK